jgi:hypothetical protein
MTHRDITGTDAQGVPAGPRPDQIPHAPLPQETEEVLEQQEDEDSDPVVDVDDLGAAVEGDGERAVDATRGKLRIR